MNKQNERTFRPVLALVSHLTKTHCIFDAFQREGCPEIQQQTAESTHRVKRLSSGPDPTSWQGWRLWHLPPRASIVIGIVVVVVVVAAMPGSLTDVETHHLVPRVLILLWIGSQL